MVDFAVLDIKSALIDRKLTAYDFSYLLSKCIVSAVTCLTEKFHLNNSAVFISTLEPEVFLVLKVTISQLSLLPISSMALPNFSLRVISFSLEISTDVLAVIRGILFTYNISVPSKREHGRNINY